MRVVRLLSRWITLTACGIAAQSASNLESWTARLSPDGRHLFTLTLILFLLNFSKNSSAQEWPHYGGDLGGTKYSPLAQINRQNVKSLQAAWTYHTGDISDGTTYNFLSTFECTPLVVDGVMYVTTPFSRVIALRAESGKELWTFDPDLDKDRPY